MEMHWPKLLVFFWLSINYASIFPIIPSLSHAANPRAIVVKCDGSVYDVDVDVYDNFPGKHVCIELSLSNTASLAKIPTYFVVSEFKRCML